MSSDPNIATLSLNPAVDMAYLVRQLVAEDKTQSTSTRFDPGGNGINVARALIRLGHETSPCCILAGESGVLLQRLLAKEQVYPVAIQVSGETRVNCTIQQRRPPVEYKVAGVGPVINAEALKGITEYFLERAGDGFGVLSGSLPEGSPEDTYAKLCDKLSQQGARAIVDARDSMLRAALETKPFMIKPNRYELEILGGKSLSSVETVAEEARKLQKSGVDFVCVSMGAEGAVLTDKENSYHAPAPKVRVRCTVGAGDAMLAGLIAALAEDKETAEVLSLGLACGSSAVTQSGTMLFKSSDLSALQDDIEVVSLDI
jgi:6-phosphofructokinase 2